MNEGKSGNGLLSRLVEGARKSGPGWLLSAYTLGAGTAITSVTAGKAFGYDLLWVNPLAMLIGVVVLSGAAYFALSSDKSPFHRFRTELHPAMAYAWGLASLLASVIWHFAQYGMTFVVAKKLLGLPEGMAVQVAVGGTVLVVSILITWQYNKGSGMLIYEGIMKFFVWMTVICLFILMFKLPIEWGQVLKGLVSFSIPKGSEILVLSLLGAAVGINMTFLYPYSVRCKGWGNEGPKLATRDLFLGMFLPFVCATGMLMIAAAAKLMDGSIGDDVIRADITQIASIFDAFGSIGPVLFLLGLLAMPLATITLHMLTCGFIISEMTGAQQGSKTWKLGTLIPAIGVLGVTYKAPLWLPVTTSALCLILLPIAYIGFALLTRRDMNKPDALAFPGGKVMLYLMYACIALITVAALFKAWNEIEKLIGMF